MPNSANSGSWRAESTRTGDCCVVWAAAVRPKKRNLPSRNCLGGIQFREGRLIRGGAGLRVERRLKLKLNRDRVADDGATGLEQLVPGESEFAAADRRLRARAADVGVARVDESVELDREGDGLGDILDRHVAREQEVAV